MNKEEVEFDELVGRTNTEKLSDLVGESFVIKNVRFATYAKGEIAFVTIEGMEKEYRTTSEVLIKQLKIIKQAIDAGRVVRVKLKKVKNYLTF